MPPWGVALLAGDAVAESAAATAVAVAEAMAVRCGATSPDARDGEDEERRQAQENPRAALKYEGETRAAGRATTTTITSETRPGHVSGLALDHGLHRCVFKSLAATSAKR